MHVTDETRQLGAVSLYIYRLTNIVIPMVKIRRSRDNLIFNMGIPYIGESVFILRQAPGYCDHPPPPPPPPPPPNWEQVGQQINQRISIFFMLNQHIRLSFSVRKTWNMFHS